MALLPPRKISRKKLLEFNRQLRVRAQLGQFDHLFQRRSHQLMWALDVKRMVKDHAYDELAVGLIDELDHLIFPRRRLAGFDQPAPTKSAVLLSMWGYWLRKYRRFVITRAPRKRSRQ